MKILAVFLWAIFVAIALPSADAQEVWMRTGPWNYSNGVNFQSPRNASMDGHSFSSKTTGDKSNEITWSEPPERVKVGETVVLTIQSSANEGCPVAGHWALSDCGERDAKGDGSAGSYKTYKREGTFNAGSITFVFKTTGTKPMMSVVAGRADDYSGDMSGSVYWIYVTEADFQKMMAKGDLKIGKPDISIEGEESNALAYTTDTVLVVVRTKPDATVELFFDDKSVASGQVNAGGRADFNITLPSDLPQGVSPHKFRATARKTGLENGEATHALEIKRGLTAITVEASPSVRRAKKDETVEITGVVYVHHSLTFNEPVKAEIQVLSGDIAISKTTTDENGFFKVAVLVKADAGEKWKVEAVPIEKTRYDKGSVKVGIESFKDGDLEISIISDKAVYPPTDKISIRGAVTTAGKPIEAMVKVAALRREEMPAFIGDVKTDADGRYQYTFPVSAVSLNKSSFVPLEGQTAIVVGASAKGYANSENAQTYVVIQDENAKRGWQEFIVTNVSGKPNASQVDPVADTGLPIDFTLKMGTKLTQGAVISTGRDEEVTLVMLFPDGGLVKITIKGNSQIRIFRFFQGPDGRVKLQINAGEPSQIGVQITPPAGAEEPLDYQIVTASAIITSIKTRYRVTVDKNGVTKIEGEEGEAIVIPINPTEKPVAVGAGRMVQVPAKAVFAANTPAVAPVTDGPTVKAQKTTFAPNEAIIIEWSNTKAHGWDWVVVAKPTDADQSSFGADLGGKWSSRVGDQKNGTKTFDGLAEGTYEARYISWDNGNNRVTARQQFTVGNAPPPTVTSPPIAGATPTRTEKAIEIEVPANKAWTATGIIIDADTYVRTEASGVVEASKPSDTRAFYHNVPPEGRDEFIGSEPQPHLRGLCLIGKLGDGPVLPVCKYVHKLHAGSPYGSGELFLGINDDDVSDNSGAWKVRITVFTGKP